MLKGKIELDMKMKVKYFHLLLQKAESKLETLLACRNRVKSKTQHQTSPLPNSILIECLRQNHRINKNCMGINYQNKSKKKFAPIRFKLLTVFPNKRNINK